MTEINKVLFDSFSFFSGKYIKISCCDFQYEGLLSFVNNKDYYYDLILKKGRYKKKITLFYPFDISFNNNVLKLDYRLSTLSKRVNKELLYNLCNGKELHPFMNKIVHICEQT